MSQKKKTKRFYKDVHIAERDGVFVVLLDQYTLKTPGKKPLSFEIRDHAECVGAEWAAQTDFIRPEKMPCTRLYNVAVERTPETRKGVIDEGVKFAKTDLLCYRDSAGTALSRHQAQNWDPLLHWASGQNLDLRVTDSILAIDQSDVALNSLKGFLFGLDDLNLTLAVHFISTLGSAVLGLAVMQKHLSAKDAYDLSQLDTLWQIAQWGEVDDAKERSDELEFELVALAALIP